MRHIVLRRGRAIFILKMWWRFCSSRRCASCRSRATSPLASVQARGRLVHLAAQQLPGRHVQRAGHGVHQRHFHRALAKALPLQGTVHARQGAFKAAAKLASRRVPGTA